MLNSLASLADLPYAWAIAAPIVLFLLGFVFIQAKARFFLYAGCVLIYLDVVFFVLILLSIGAATGIAGWVWHILFEPEKTAPPVEKLTNAFVALSLTFLTGSLLKLRQVHPASAVLRRVIRYGLKRKAPAVLPSGPNARKKDSLAYRAFHDDEFADDDLPAIKGWGISASYRRLKLLNRL